MERIVVEVNNEIAKSWRYSSEERRKKVSDAINKMLEIAFSGRGDDFITFVKELQNKATERGLTEEILNEILSGKD